MFRELRHLRLEGQLRGSGSGTRGSTERGGEGGRWLSCALRKEQRAATCLLGNL